MVYFNMIGLKDIFWPPPLNFKPQTLLVNPPSVTNFKEYFEIYLNI